MASGDLAEVQRLYAEVKSQLKLNIASEATGRAIHDFALLSLRFLAADCARVSLKSLVPGKTYFSFIRNGAPGVVARPANAALFELDPEGISDRWGAWWRGAISPDELAKMSYTIALAPCLVMELFDRANLKGPATYFECPVLWRKCRK